MVSRTTTRTARAAKAEGARHGIVKKRTLLEKLSNGAKKEARSSNQVVTKTKRERNKGVKAEAKRDGCEWTREESGDGDEGPFPGFSRPHPEECRSVTRVLMDLHGDPSRDWQSEDEDRLQVEVERVSVLDSLVGTILSQNTTDKTSHKAYASLKRSFPTWESVRVGDPALVAESIRVGGLSEIKTRRIQSILNAVREERGECSLEHLRSQTSESVKEYLSKFKGVGPKTISCVLMFCLERPEFPVDVHVWKIAISLGWVPARATREQTYEHLNRRVPDDVKYSLHVLLVEHGKVYQNDVKLLRPCVKEALEGRDEGRLARPM